MKDSNCASLQYNSSSHTELSEPSVRLRTIPRVTTHESRVTTGPSTTGTATAISDRYHFTAAILSMSGVD